MSEAEKSPVTVLERSHNLRLRTPTVEDGKQIWQLIKGTGVLDLNSSYSYLLWAKYFDDTSVVVEWMGRLSVLYLDLFNRKSLDTLFVWQVAVDASQRGKGLSFPHASSAFA